MKIIVFIIFIFSQLFSAISYANENFEEEIEEEEITSKRHVRKNLFGFRFDPLKYRKLTFKEASADREQIGETADSTTYFGIGGRYFGGFGIYITPYFFIDYSGATYDIHDDVRFTNTVQRYVDGYPVGETFQVKSEAVVYQDSLEIGAALYLSSFIAELSYGRDQLEGTRFIPKCGSCDQEKIDLDGGSFYGVKFMWSPLLNDLGKNSDAAGAGISISLSYRKYSNDSDIKDMFQLAITLGLIT